MVSMNSTSDSLPEVNVDVWLESLRRLEAPVPESEQVQRETYRSIDGRFVHVRQLDLAYVDLPEFVRLLDHTKVESRSHGGIIRIHGFAFSYLGLISSIYAKRTDPQGRTHQMVCEKLQMLAEKVPAPKKSLTDRVFDCFFCHDCGQDVEYIEKRLFSS